MDPQQIAGCTWRGHAIVHTVDGVATFHDRHGGPWTTARGEEHARAIAITEKRMQLVRDPVVVEVELRVVTGGPEPDGPAEMGQPLDAGRLAEEILERCEEPEDLPHLLTLRKRLLQLADAKWRNREAIAKSTGVKVRTIYGLIGGARRLRREVDQVAGDRVSADADQLGGPVEEGGV
jgi:hypothetical protein